MFSIHCIILYNVQHVYSNMKENENLEKTLLNKDKIYDRVYNNIKNIKQNKYLSSTNKKSNSNSINSNKKKLKNEDIYSNTINSNSISSDTGSENIDLKERRV